jgi:peptidoglycan hydrolase-like protein with peptidoglycan-binding domain
MFLPSNITLKFGDSGDFVSELQRRLVAVSCFSAEAINGFYDGSTVNGVSQFQSMSGIRADGIAGPETLRRLNGVISGDTSTTDTKKAEEEARLQQENLMRQQIAQQQLYEQQALLAQQQQQQAYAAQMQQHAAAEAQLIAAQQQPTAAVPPAPAYDTQLAPAPMYQPAPQPANYQPPQPAPSVGDDVLARMLLGQPSAQPQPQPINYQPPQPPAQTYAAVPPTAAIPPAPPAMAVPPTAPLPPVAPVVPVPAAPAIPENASMTAAPEPQRGMLGRAVQFMSEKMQQLHAYFESKLPNHVLNEVKAIGVVMAQSGVKEASIPTGPEPQRGIEGPQRGQQQGQQRG